MTPEPFKVKSKSYSSSTWEKKSDSKFLNHVVLCMRLNSDAWVLARHIGISSGIPSAATWPENAESHIIFPLL